MDRLANNNNRDNTIKILATQEKSWEICLSSREKLYKQKIY